MILDRLDRRAVVVSKSEDGDRVAHVIGQYLALLCAYWDLKGLLGLERDRSNFLPFQALRQDQGVSLLPHVHVPEFYFGVDGACSD